MFNEVLKILIIFRIHIKKVGFITLMLIKFQILNANMWSIHVFIWQKWISFLFIFFEIMYYYVTSTDTCFVLRGLISVAQKN